MSDSPEAKVNLFDAETQRCPYDAYKTLRDEAPALRAAHKAMLLHHRALLALVDDNDFALSFLDAEEAPTADQDEAGES